MSRDAEGRRASIGARRNPASEAAVVAAAEALLAERGYGGFSIDEVARRAGAGKPTIYRWWPTKADLLAAVYASGRASRLAPPDTGRLAADLSGFARALFALWRETPAGEALRGLLAEAQTSDAARAALWERFHPDWTRPLRAVFAAAARRGETEPADVDLLAELYAGLLWGRLLVGRIDDDRSALERIGRLLAAARGRK